MEVVSGSNARVKRMLGLSEKIVARDIVVPIALLLPTLVICLYNVGNSGSLWPDAPQYANAGAMIRDWLFSGDFLHPYEFAKQNYFQYPAFHLPYHPPVYPGLLGFFFAVTGVSYFSGRLFVALCLWVASCFFHAILRERGVERVNAFAATLLFISIPEIAFWSRDTMSEVPALALMIAGSYYFLIWLRTNRLLHYAIAFGFAEAAFLSRYLTAGILLAWVIWAISEGRFRKLLSPTHLIPPALFLSISVAWVMFAVRFSKFETGYGTTPPNTNYVSSFSWVAISYYLHQIPTMLGWATLLLTVIAVAWAIFANKKYAAVFFWASWIIGCWILLMGVGIYNERRYFIYVLPAVPGLASCFLNSNLGNRFVRYVPLALLALCLIYNTSVIASFPRGVVGYENVARELASLQTPGNVLLASWLDSDLIFHYRSNNPTQQRIMIRGDRSLTIRPPTYSDEKPIVVAGSAEGVLDVIKRGRIRYLITCDEIDPNIETRTDEMSLLHDTVRTQPERFKLIGEFPLLIEYGKRGTSAKVYLWEFQGELPAGPSEISVDVPTADMQIKPNR